MLSPFWTVFFPSKCCNKELQAVPFIKMWLVQQCTTKQCVLARCSWKVSISAVSGREGAVTAVQVNGDWQEEQAVLRSKSGAAQD